MNKELLGEMEIYAGTNHVPIILTETRELLKVLTSIKKPKKVLEIGTAIGYSSILIKEHAHRDCKIDTVDCDYEMILQARKNIEKAGYTGDINIIFGDATEVLTSLNTKYDMIFFDAAKNQYNEYYKYSLDLFDDDALLIADNVLYKGLINDLEYKKRKNRTIIRSLRKFIFTISNDEKLVTTILDIGDGVSISSFKGVK